jgi:putative endonuclease
VAATTPKSAGDHAETLALEHLQRHGLALVCRNYRVARGPHARGGEIDLIVRERDGTLVFVEVRARASSAFGGALASVTARKRQRVVLAARHYLAGLARIPPCRFDVVAIEGARVPWGRGAFAA